MFNPEILAMLEKKYKEMPKDAESVALTDIPLLGAFRLFKNNEPDFVTFKFIDEENNINIYIGSNKKKSEE